jgi:hypothetical protein
MDPEFFQRLNSLQNYQNQQANQANLEQLQANQTELAVLRRQLAEEANKPQCPHCGGPSEKGFDRCKNCGQEVVWIGHFVGKPSDRAELEMAMEQYELEIKRHELEVKRKQKARTQRQQAKRKEWEVAHPGHKWEDRGKLEAKRRKREEVDDGTPCLVVVIIVIVLIVWEFFQMMDRNNGI